MFIYREVEQLVARQAHNLEVACSSPALATKLNDNNLKHRLLFFLCKKTDTTSTCTCGSGIRILVLCEVGFFSEFEATEKV